jgi:hypothetical protein
LATAEAASMAMARDESVRQALDVRGQRRVVLQVSGGVLADDVDHPGAGALGVVDVGQAIGETGTQVQQRRSRLVAHPVPAIGRPSSHALEQAQHALHSGIFQRRQEVHFRRARVGEADLDALVGKRVHKAFGAVHLNSSTRRRACCDARSL